MVISMHIKLVCPLVRKDSPQFGGKCIKFVVDIQRVWHEVIHQTQF